MLFPHSVTNSQAGSSSRWRRRVATSRGRFLPASQLTRNSEVMRSGPGHQGGRVNLSGLLRALTGFGFTTPKPSRHYHAELKTGSWYSSGAGYLSLMKNSMRICFVSPLQGYRVRPVPGRCTLFIFLLIRVVKIINIIRLKMKIYFFIDIETVYD
jgi:hypothetical protein